MSWSVISLVGYAVPNRLSFWKFGIGLSLIGVWKDWFAKTPSSLIFNKVFLPFFQFQSEYELSPDEKRLSKAQQIYEKYLLAEVSFKLLQKFVETSVDLRDLYAIGTKVCVIIFINIQNEEILWNNCYLWLKIKVLRTQTVLF